MKNIKIFTVIIMIALCSCSKSEEEKEGAIVISTGFDFYVKDPSGKDLLKGKDESSLGLMVYDITGGGSLAVGSEGKSYNLIDPKIGSQYRRIRVYFNPNYAISELILKWKSSDPDTLKSDIIKPNVNSSVRTNVYLNNSLILDFKSSDTTCTLVKARL